MRILRELVKVILVMAVIVLVSLAAFVSLNWEEMEGGMSSFGRVKKISRTDSGMGEMPFAEQGRA